jgi:hypothetical protein
MKPKLGSWYRRDGVGVFQVTGIDTDLETIETTLKGGEVGEWDQEDWDEAVSCDEIVEVVDEDDIGYDEEKDDEE